MASVNPTKCPVQTGTDISKSNPVYVIENVKPYQLVGCLLYFANSTRPDVAHAAKYLSRKVHEPTLEFWNVTKVVIRYLKDTDDL